MEKHRQRHPDKNSVVSLGNNLSNSLDKRIQSRFKLDCCQDLVLCTFNYMEISTIWNCSWRISSLFPCILCCYGVPRNDYNFLRSYNSSLCDWSPSIWIISSHLYGRILYICFILYLICLSQLISYDCRRPFPLLLLLLTHRPFRFSPASLISSF